MNEGCYFGAPESFFVILFIKRLNKNELCISKYPFSNGTRERGKDCLDRALLRSHLEYTMIRKGKNKMLKIYDE